MCIMKGVFMRYILIFGTTLIITLLILFYPSKYLAKYENELNIEYDYKDEGYEWNYEINNDNIILKENNNDKWTFIPNKDGKSTITFTYSKEDNVKYKIIYDLKIKGNKIYWINGMGYGLLSYPNPY